MKSITEEEMAAAIRSGDSPAAYANRRLGLGSQSAGLVNRFADVDIGGSSPDLSRIVQLANRLPEAVKYATLDELQELVPVLERFAAMIDRDV